MMSPADVLDVLSLLQQAGATAWVDGGWGIDALLGEVTREHSDLDLVVFLPDLPAILASLRKAGYRTILRDWLPTALAVADDHSREIDLHPVTPTPDGGGDQVLPDGENFHYPPPAVGALDGREVKCVDAETQLRCHLGYQPSIKDQQDMLRLSERFSIELPPPYHAGVDS